MTPPTVTPKRTSARGPKGGDKPVDRADMAGGVASHFQTPASEGPVASAADTPADLQPIKASTPPRPRGSTPGLAGDTALGDTYSRRQKPKRWYQHLSILWFPFGWISKLYRFNRKLGRFVIFNLVFLIIGQLFLGSGGALGLLDAALGIDDGEAGANGTVAAGDVLKVGSDVTAAMNGLDLNKLSRPDGMSEEAFAKSQARVNKILTWIGQRILAGDAAPGGTAIDVQQAEAIVQGAGATVATTPTTEIATTDTTLAPQELKKLTAIVKGEDSPRAEPAPAPVEAEPTPVLEQPVKLGATTTPDKPAARPATAPPIAIVAGNAERALAPDATAPRPAAAPPATASAVRQTAPTPLLAEMEHKAALKAIEDGEDAKAIRHLRIAVSVAPEFDAAQKLLTDRLVSAGLQSSAVVMLERCLQEAPGQWRTAVRLSTLLAMRGRIEQAWAVLDANPPSDPREPEYLALRASLPPVPRIGARKAPVATATARPNVDADAETRTVSKRAQP